eukprot:418801_1
MEQYAKLTIPWQKERFLKKTKSGFLKIQKEKQQKSMEEEEKQRLAQLDEQIHKSEEDFNRLKEEQDAMKLKLKDPNFAPEKEEITEHAMELSIMLAEQKVFTENLKQSKEVIIQFLRDDGREALVQFFKMKKVLD